MKMNVHAKCELLNVSLLHMDWPFRVPESISIIRPTNLNFVRMIVFYSQRMLNISDCLCSMITKDESCTRKIKGGIAIAQAALNKKKALFTSELDLNWRKKVVSATFGAQLHVLKLGHCGD